MSERAQHKANRILQIEQLLLAHSGELAGTRGAGALADEHGRLRGCDGGAGGGAGGEVGRDGGGGAAHGVGVWGGAGVGA